MVGGTLASARRARAIGWSFALLGSALLLITGWLLVRWVESGPQPAYLSPGGAPVAEPRPTPRPSSLLRMAGSGSNLPLTRALADAFLAKRPWLRVRVHESIGSSGGIRAVHDRAVEIGLASRPLKPSEEQLGLVAIPYAKVAVVVAGNPTVPLRSVSREQLLALYDGREQFWSDGSEVVVYQREPGDSGHLAVRDAVPGFAEVDERALTARRWSVLFHDRAMQEALIATPGAIGLFDQGLAVLQDLPLLLLEYEGIPANEDNLRSGRYPLSKELAFVLPAADHDALAHEFIAFVFSAEGQKIIRDSGYLPIDPPARSAFAHLRAVGPPP